MQTIKEVNPHPHIVPCVNMWSVTFSFFFYLCHVLNVGTCICIAPGKAKWNGPHKRRREENECKFHSVTCCTNSIVSRIHVNTIKLRNITCTLLAADVILRSLEFLSFRIVYTMSSSNIDGMKYYLVTPQ